MKFRALLSSAAFATVMIGTAALAPEALAQKGMTLEPKGNWAVTTVNNDGGAGYCAMARRFDDGMIMTLARNERAETSLALDFKQGAFNTGENLSIALDPGAGEQRSYNIAPVSKKAFVVRLGDDPPFFDALSRTGFLRVEVDRQFYNFNLADIDQGQQQLDQCIVSMTEPAAGGYADLTPMPGEGGAPGDVYMSQLQEMQRQLEAIRSENAKLAMAVQGGGAIQPVSAPGSSMIYDARIKALEGEKEKLQIQLAQARSNNAAETQSDGSLRAEMQQLRTENISLAADLTALKTTDIDKSALLARVSALEEENRRLSQFGGAPSSGSGDPVALAPVQSLAAENRRLQTALNECSSADFRIEPGTQFVTGQAAEVFGSHISKLREENDRLTRILDAIQSENAQLRAGAPSNAASYTPPAQDHSALEPAAGHETEAEIIKTAAVAPAAPPAPQRKPYQPETGNVYGILRDDPKVVKREQAAAGDTMSGEGDVLLTREPDVAASRNAEDEIRQSADAIESSLRTAGLALEGPVSIAAQPGSLRGAAVYQWQSESLSGTAERRSMRGSEGFDDAVHEYIEAFKAKCGPGDFAFMPDRDREQNGVRIASYDVACVGSAVDKSAALLFIRENGVLTVFSHETKADRLAGAMDARDALAQVIKGQNGLRG